MLTIQTVKGQTLYNLAIQLYGNADAVDELIALNPELQSDYSSQPEDLGELDYALPVIPGIIVYDEFSELRDDSVLKDLAAAQIDIVKTFQPLP